ncbi:MAG: hypothetical protein M5U01_14645 [Ardenticatenaceae bacterium]|nr:hypothetical protein [Ardenticatenaceae bacterium]
MLTGGRQAPDQEMGMTLERRGRLATGETALMAAEVAEECFEGGIPGRQVRNAIAVEEIGAPIGE